MKRLVRLISNFYLNLVYLAPILMISHYCLWIVRIKIKHSPGKSAWTNPTRSGHLLTIWLHSQLKMPFNNVTMKGSLLLKLSSGHLVRDANAICTTKANTRPLGKSRGRLLSPSVPRIQGGMLQRWNVRPTSTTYSTVGRRLRRLMLKRCNWSKTPLDFSLYLP